MTAAIHPWTPLARPRVLSEADCHEIAGRLARFASGGGGTDMHLVSRWMGNVRWARNRIYTTGEDRDTQIAIRRTVHGASSYNEVTINEVSDAALVAAVRRVERLLQADDERVDTDVETRPGSPFRYQDEPAVVPHLFFESTYQLDAAHRAEVARRLMQMAADAGMLSAGYIQVSATSFATITSWGYAQFYQYTWAQCSMTVRDPKGIGSGWAGVDWPDWNRIDGGRLSALALDKCLKSRNPVAVEPGRYTTILEPQAVCDFVGQWGGQSGRKSNEEDSDEPFHKSGREEPPNLGNGQPLALSRLGEKVIDERITIRSDPMDPESGFPPYSKAVNQIGGTVYHPATWIDRGVLTALAYDRHYATTELGRDTALPAPGAFRMNVDGPTASVEEMIAATKRGLLVTRFDRVAGPYGAALLCLGYTRDGLWLIENGKISKAVKNMMFVESILFALNNVEQLGVPQRTFHPEAGGEIGWSENPKPVVVPPMKIRDFSFTALSNAI